MLWPEALLKRDKMNNRAENRKHPRVKTHITVRYRNLREGAGAPGESSLTADMSRGGIRFRAEEFISMACRLILELDIPICSKPIKAISRVAWIRKADSGNEYEIGNQFLEMSKKDQDLISEYVGSITHPQGSSSIDQEADDEFSSDTPKAKEE